MNITKKNTSRGFPIVEFKDFYGAKCSIQQSSIADERCIWFGVDNANPKIMASQAKLHDIETHQDTGWVEYPIPKDVLLTTRMHLTQGQVKELLPILKAFASTGELP